ncbi:hemerythrin domain-containing protein [Blastococcus mobilis]|uniref:Hemerythrin HHE cation binding domain-containing protein n=1 Tax=Blastococcus mobilis TaxID=1938746 RepID=A0A238Y2J6_9ACTN|nr:hemerythrin domain-containing protein [Blastococcus mobilis]SNR65011.1 Hemerythrin HHE cation binding domain-containing protein [Blastococcus mobilis]
MPRSIAHQTVEELGGPGSVLARQRADHVELDRLLNELDGSTGTDQEEVLGRIDRLVFSHAFAEETVLWPVLRRVLPDGDALTLQVEKEHQEVNELVSALEADGLDDPRRPARLARLVEVLREDVRDEEDVLFPRLQEAVTVEELRRLGRRWELMRRLSPTRPHPTVSRRPPGNALSGLPLTVLDRTRDLVDAGVRRAPERLVPAGKAVSRGLAGLAALVERVPLSRTGDRPPTSR